MSGLDLGACVWKCVALKHPNIRAAASARVLPESMQYHSLFSPLSAPPRNILQQIHDVFRTLHVRARKIVPLVCGSRRRCSCRTHCQMHHSARLTIAAKEFSLVLPPKSTRGVVGQLWPQCLICACQHTFVSGFYHSGTVCTWRSTHCTQQLGVMQS